MLPGFIRCQIESVNVPCLGSGESLEAQRVDGLECILAGDSGSNSSPISESVF
jgi:hypothetical protein